MSAMSHAEGVSDLFPVPPILSLNPSLCTCKISSKIFSCEYLCMHNYVHVQSSPLFSA